MQTTGSMYSISSSPWKQATGHTVTQSVKLAVVGDNGGHCMLLSGTRRMLIPRNAVVVVDTDQRWIISRLRWRAATTSFTVLELLAVPLHGVRR